MDAIRFVTLDCAGTLVRVDWQPGRFATECLESLGAVFDRGDAESTYNRILQSRWREYQELNLSRDESIGDGFWRELTQDWLAKIGLDAGFLEPTLELAHRRLYGDPSVAFCLYADTVPALIALQERGVKLAVLSNWDYSLHRVLRILGLTDYFDVVVASLEEGVEKPEPRIFEVVLERLGADPRKTLHVGDDPLDDVIGASRAGLRSAFLDRSSPQELPKRICDLRQIIEVLDWTG
ncbi:MAG TPA: HAD-IA family hydrolase [Fimbriimonadaceae bacterium]|nr:HAD-IA family hydrolase [Fimbriimonadaceae bacterium]